MEICEMLVEGGSVWRSVRCSWKGLGMEIFEMLAEEKIFEKFVEGLAVEILEVFFREFGSVLVLWDVLNVWFLQKGMIDASIGVQQKGWHNVAFCTADAKEGCEKSRNLSPYCVCVCVSVCVCVCVFVTVCMSVCQCLPL